MYWFPCEDCFNRQECQNEGWCEPARLAGLRNQEDTMKDQDLYLPIRLRDGDEPEIVGDCIWLYEAGAYMALQEYLDEYYGEIDDGEEFAILKVVKQYEFVKKLQEKQYDKSSG